MAITPKNNDPKEPKLYDFSYISMTNPMVWNYLKWAGNHIFIFQPVCEFLMILTLVWSSKLDAGEQHSDSDCHSCKSVRQIRFGSNCPAGRMQCFFSPLKIINSKVYLVTLPNQIIYKKKIRVDFLIKNMICITVVCWHC